MRKSVLAFTAEVFKPLVVLIDKLQVPEEEKLKVRDALAKVQNEVALKHMELLTERVDSEKQLLEARSQAISSEATGASWMQRNWRPITMLVFVGLIVLETFGLLPGTTGLPKEFMSLVKIGLGGYVIGRSVEKAGPAIARSLRK